MCSTQPCLPRAFCTFCTPKTIPQPRNTAPFTSPRASAKHGAATPNAPAASLPSIFPPQPRLHPIMRLPSRSPPSLPCASRLHLPSPAPSPPMRLPSRSPPSSRPHPCPSRLAPPSSLPAPSPPMRRLAPLHLPSPAPSPPMRLPSTHAPPVSLPSIYSLPNPVPTRAPPASLPSIFPPQPRPHPCAFRLAPLHLLVPTHASRLAPLHLFPPQPRPHPCASRLAPLPSFPSLFLPFRLPFPTPSTSTSIFRPRQRSPPALATKRKPKHRRCFWKQVNISGRVSFFGGPFAAPLGGIFEKAPLGGIFPSLRSQGFFHGYKYMAILSLPFLQRLRLQCVPARMRRPVRMPAPSQVVLSRVRTLSLCAVAYWREVSQDGPSHPFRPFRGWTGVQFDPTAAAWKLVN